MGVPHRENDRRSYRFRHVADSELDGIAGRAEAAEHACEWQEAAALFRELFQHAVEARAVERIPEALLGSARALSPDTATEEAEELAWLAHEIAQRTGQRDDAATSLNVVGTVLHRRNDLPGARVLYARALDRARDLGNDRLVAMTCLNLGVCYHTLGNLREARAHYLESVSAGIRSGIAEHAMRAYNNLGMVCTHLGEWLEAQLHLDRGIEIAERLNNLPTLALLCTNRAEPLIHLGERDRAREQINRAEALALRVGQPNTLAEVGRLRAMIARAEDRLDAADDELRRVLALADEHDLELCRAELLEELALLRRQQGRSEEALDALERAFEGFFTVGARRNVSRVGARLEEWREEARHRVRI